MSLTAERNLTTDSSGDSGTDIMFRIGLKGLGDFQSSSNSGWGNEDGRERRY
jgi:LPS-assembly protein